MSAFEIRLKSLEEVLMERDQLSFIFQQSSFDTLLPSILHCLDPIGKKSYTAEITSSYEIFSL